MKPEMRDPASTLPRIVVVAGPTGVGKTALGVALGQAFNGELVNADSRYLYRGFDIGTAKPDLNERGDVPHHLIDILDPGDDFSLATYQALANQAIAEVLARGHLPILVGGTPLYVKAVIEGWSIPRVPPHPAIRDRLEREIAESGLAPVAERLADVDPVAAERCGVNPRRIIRALEIFEVTGIPMSAQEGKGPRPYRTLELGLHRERNDLYAVIDRRVDQLIAQGLLDEIRGLLSDGVSPDAPAFTSIGYRQLLPFLRGEESLEDGIARIKHDTHRYARHQETWLRGNPDLVRIHVSEPDWQGDVFARVRRFLEDDDAPGQETL
jgi:tRNA dimethylallyltransferase